MLRVVAGKDEERARAIAVAKLLDLIAPLNAEEVWHVVELARVLHQPIGSDGATLSALLSHQQQALKHR